MKQLCIFNCWATALPTEATGVLLAQRNIMEIWIVFLGGSSTKFYCSYSICKNLERQIFHLEIVLTFDLSLPTFLVS